MATHGDQPMVISQLHSNKPVLHGRMATSQYCLAAWRLASEAQMHVDKP
jgi:hypothetical protein